jgi:hypothetical protein
VLGVLSGCGNHPWRKVDPNAPIDAIGEDLKMGSIATAYVEDHNGRGESGVTVEDANPVPQ